mmetsp:Transcript_15166/g.39022  ORF Transcript_15166/g.39022 Transcript_15166/m.39022 type:complete len:247 (+) Transcript_15166:247-987(+)
MRKPPTARKVNRCWTQRANGWEQLAWHLLCRRVLPQRVGLDVPVVDDPGVLTTHALHDDDSGQQEARHGDHGGEPSREAPGHRRLGEDLLQDAIGVKGIFRWEQRKQHLLEQQAHIEAELVPVELRPVFQRLVEVGLERRMVGCHIGRLHCDLHALAKIFDRVHQHIRLPLVQTALLKRVWQLHHGQCHGSAEASFLLSLLLGALPDEPLALRLFLHLLRVEVHDRGEDLLEEEHVVGNASLNVDV